MNTCKSWVIMVQDFVSIKNFHNLEIGERRPRLETGPNSTFPSWPSLSPVRTLNDDTYALCSTHNNNNNIKNISKRIIKSKEVITAT